MLSKRFFRTLKFSQSHSFILVCKIRQPAKQSHVSRACRVMGRALAQSAERFNRDDSSVLCRSVAFIGYGELASVIQMRYRRSFVCKYRTQEAVPWKLSCLSFRIVLS